MSVKIIKHRTKQRILKKMIGEWRACKEPYTVCTCTLHKIGFIILRVFSSPLIDGRPVVHFETVCGWVKFLLATL